MKLSMQKSYGCCKHSQHLVLYIFINDVILRRLVQVCWTRTFEAGLSGYFYHLHLLYSTVFVP